MLQFTPDQMAAAERAAEDALVAQVAADIRAAHPDEVGHMPDDDLRFYVRNGFARARARGFRTSGGLAGWVSVMFDMAPNFDEHPAIAELLVDRRFEESERVRQALTMLPPAVWEAVLDAHDDAAWVRS